MVGQNK